MAPLVQLLASLLLALPLATAVPASSPSSSPSSSSSTPNGVVSMPLRRVVGPRPDAVVGARRAAMMAQPWTAAEKAAQKHEAAPAPPRQALIDRNEYYLADLAIGTPPQPVSLLVDTGGWVTWVNPDCARAVREAECSALPAYNLSLSSPPPTAVHDLDQIVYYGDVSMGAALEGYADVFTWGNATHVRQPFGVANETVGLTTGILALAPDASAGFNSAVSNLSVVATLAQQGVIASRVFSLAFGRGLVAVAQHVGHLVFGGVDRNQFRGPLGRTPILPRDDSVDGWRYWLAVTEVRHNKPGGRNATAKWTAPAAQHTTTATTTTTTTTVIPSGHASYMVDSGTTGIYVPRSAYDAIMLDANLTRNPLRFEGFPDVDCKMADLPGSLSFTFAPVASANKSAAANVTNSSTPAAPVTIDVPYSVLIHPERNLITNDTSMCFFGLSSGGPADDDGDIFPILGVEFFKAAYAVFDWDNQEVSLAQGASCGSEPDLVPVGKGPNAVPSVTGNCK
ncbi:hypothetical protein HMPREF1624_01434 [Sporothrix schenckii ATCC 58251]|uniref:Peptidase A1 domain-containing protein n=1 Tax=Sporothrix schenckii (strain ATCC 58251 / de Perez 2211183) TaxID=1391915 RepID=U7Q5F4_SPOS1|nr:hypothetical protein HMPREF1624_01434 [Sporothrix schenckii ATCC 58251]